MLAGVFFSCSSKGDGSLSTVDLGDGNNLVLCDFSKVGDTIDVPLSEWLEDCMKIRTRLCLNSGGLLFRKIISAYVNRMAYSDGTFNSDIEIGEKLNKPKIVLNEDGSLTMVHICFEKRNKIYAAHITKDGEVTTFAGKFGETINPIDKDGSFVGFNNETWCYQNVLGMVYMMMPNDTLYSYDVEKGATMHFVRLKNDKFGNLDAPFNFSNGYFFVVYKPMQLADKIEKRLAESSCTAQNKKTLNELLDSLNENDNNVMFIGKLKK